MNKLSIPDAPRAIQKGIPLKLLLDEPAIRQLANNMTVVFDRFDSDNFIAEALQDIGPLSLKERAKKISHALKQHLPDNYSEAIDLIVQSFTPPLYNTDNLGLSGMFYMPHASFIEEFGLNVDYNQGIDPFDISMKAQYELTQRFTAEFSIRPFIITYPERTFKKLYHLMGDKNPHVRRLCSEGTRPRLPWAQKIPLLIKDPSPSIPILEKLKNDEDLYVWRSVANHLGDIAKDNLSLTLNICEKWLSASSKDVNWVIRHALRHPAKKGNEAALSIRKAAK